MNKRLIRKCSHYPAFGSICTSGMLWDVCTFARWYMGRVYQKKRPRANVIRWRGHLHWAKTNLKRSSPHDLSISDLSKLHSAVPVFSALIDIRILMAYYQEFRLHIQLRDRSAWRTLNCSY